MGNTFTDELSWIFHDFLPMISARSVDVAANIAGFGSVPRSELDYRLGSLGLSASELAEKVAWKVDISSVWLSVVLWKQRLGIVDPGFPLDLFFENDLDDGFAPRFARENGYETTGARCSSERETYLEYVAEIAGSAENVIPEDSSDFRYLVHCLNVAGVGYERSPHRALAEHCAEEILGGFSRSHRLDDLSVTAAVFLLSDLGEDPGRIWPAYRYFVRESSPFGMRDFPAWQWALRTYGEEAERDLARLSLPLPLDVIIELSKTDEGYEPDWNSEFWQFVLAGAPIPEGASR